MKSLITGGPVTPLFSAVVLGQYNVTYYRCDDTGFIQTDPAYWLAEAYTDAITALDVGLVQRNLTQAKLTTALIERSMPKATRFIDYGGGYGLFTRLMRDKGFPFLHHDPHCVNIFAAGFEAGFSSEAGVSRYDLLTAWEVFEHLSDPIAVIKTLVQQSRRVLFSTVLVPNETPGQIDDWWYFTPETGQHVSFFTAQSLRRIANDLGIHYYTDNISLHLFSSESLGQHPFTVPWRQWPVQLAKDLSHLVSKFTQRRNSLLEHDFELALKRLQATHQTTGVSSDQT